MLRSSHYTESIIAKRIPTEDKTIISHEFKWLIERGWNLELESIIAKLQFLAML